MYNVDPSRIVVTGLNKVHPCKLQHLSVFTNGPSFSLLHSPEVGQLSAIYVTMIWAFLICEHSRILLSLLKYFDHLQIEAFTGTLRQFSLAIDHSW